MNNQPINIGIVLGASVTLAMGPQALVARAHYDPGAATFPRARTFDQTIASVLSEWTALTDRLGTDGLGSLDIDYSYMARAASGAVDLPEEELTDEDFGALMAIHTDFPVTLELDDVEA